MSDWLKSWVIILFAATFLAACAVAPRTSDWASPKKFTQEQVFKAALGAGAEIGYSITSKDSDSYSLTLSRGLGGTTQITLIAQVRNKAGVIHVITNINYNDLAVSGLHEEEIKKFHAALFRNLNISEDELNNVKILQAQ